MQQPTENTGPDVQLNLNVRGLNPSATIAINERSNALMREGRRIFKLGLGQSPFPVPEPVVEALRRHAAQKDYLSVQGLLPLREAVAAHHCRVFDFDRSPQDVLIGPGSKELMFLLQLVYYGDLVIPTPTWVSYAPQAQIVGRAVRWLPTHVEDDWKLRPEQLDALCRSDPGRPRLVILNYPSNPTGVTYRWDELEAIAEVARHYRLIVLSDEIYGRLHHEGQHRSILDLYPQGTIFSGGLSKWCGAGGWRLGLFVFPPNLRWLLQAMASVASETFTSTSAPIQYAAIEAFEDHPEIERYLRNARRILRALGRTLSGALNDAGAHVPPPQGGFYLFPDFSLLTERLRRRGIRTSTELCEALLEDTGVATLPGAAFGRPDAELTARLAYVNFDGAAALDAAAAAGPDVELDDEFLRTHCADTMEAVDRTCDWVHSILEPPR
jgi:aspartate aminotransferase